MNGLLLSVLPSPIGVFIHLVSLFSYKLKWNAEKGKIIRNRDDIAGIKFLASCDCLIRKTVKRLKYFRNMIALLQGTNGCEINAPRQVVVFPLFLTSSICHKKKKFLKYN